MSSDEKKLIVVTALFKSNRYAEVDSATRTFVVPEDLDVRTELLYFLRVMKREILAQKKFSAVEWIENKVTVRVIDKGQLKAVADSFQEVEDECRVAEIRLVRFKDGVE